VNPISITDLCLDPRFFAAQFGADSWRTWLVFLRVLFGIKLTNIDDRAIAKRHTGRSQPPSGPIREAWVIAGRRAGKSRIAALVAVYVACFLDHSKVLSAGEVGTVAIIAADRRQARVIMRYIVGLLESVPMLAAMIESRTAESITLTNRVSIEVHTASWRSVRGYTVLAAICDEISFWRTDESANPDKEILDALRPGMATTNGLLLCVSSPYATRGALYDAHRRHFGQDDSPVLVWAADTRSMNPRVSQQIITDAYADDPAAARSEYGSDGAIYFRTDVSSYADLEMLRARTIPGRIELPPMRDGWYYASCDAAGGAGRDSFTACIGHTHVNGNIIIDKLIEVRPPFSPAAAVEHIASVLRTYRVGQITGDLYAGEFVAEAFRRQCVAYVSASMTRSEAYLGCLPLLSGGLVELLDHPRLLAQFAQLERRTTASGKDSVDHPRGGHDDLSNSVALLIAETARRSRQRVGTAKILWG
jgi:hypothetical protein